MRFHRSGLAFALITGVLSSTSGTEAATISTSAVFFDTIATPGEPLGNLNSTIVTNPTFAPGAAFLNWGTLKSGGIVPNGQSGFVYEGASALDIGVPADNTTFTIGTFYHRNNPIYSDGIATTKLKISVSIADTTSIQQDLVFGLDLLETLNYPGSGVCEAGGGMPCADRVKFTNDGFSDRSIRIGSQDYFVQVVGFLEPGGAGPLTEFLTKEKSLNQAHLVARFTTDTVTHAPIPAAGWMFLSALGSLAVVARRKRRVAS
jgi:hypothetical protein